ncbi:hypothetical protein Psi01_58270 [Planobispora siamensis]|uniref:Uncharacterized protein n=1 Tax=Planobispora siamensis TaxID=936338 RepID=A0A8J3SJ14_9ACTN|nr:hypothetical protein Psi01_58270 [Planobispora siamensis]
MTTAPPAAIARLRFLLRRSAAARASRSSRDLMRACVLMVVLAPAGDGRSGTAGRGVVRLAVTLRRAVRTACQCPRSTMPQDRPDPPGSKVLYGHDLGPGSGIRAPGALRRE